MQLVRFGKRCINMDHVVEIEFIPAGDPRSFHNDPDGYRLWLDYLLDGSPNWVWVGGADSIALELWLQDNSADVRAPMEIEA